MSYLQSQTYQKPWGLTSILVGVLIIGFWINATQLMAQIVIGMKIDGIIEVGRADEWFLANFLPKRMLLVF